MNYISKTILLIAILLLTIIFSVILWDFISLEYSNPGNVIGEYSEKKISSYNNLIRYLFFTITPIIVFLVSYIFLFNKKMSEILKIFKNDYPIMKSNNFLLIILVIFIILSLLNFLSIEFSLSKADYFHEGLSLSTGLNSKLNGLFWSSSFISNSFFSEFLNPRIAWFVSQKESIGSFRVYHEFLRLITEIILIYLIYSITKIFNFSKNKELFFFVIICIIGIYLNRSLTEYFYPIRFRDIPIFFSLIFILKIITKKSCGYINPILLGSISCASILVSLDRGIYINLLLITVIIIFVIKKKYLDNLLIILGVIIGWVSFYLYFDFNEIQNFLLNSYYMIGNIDLIAGIEYPKPFDLESGKHASRATKNLLIIIINGIFLIYLIFDKKIIISQNSKLFLIIFFILGYINYKTGITRSDSYHMKQAIFLQLLLLSVFIFLTLTRLNFIFRKKIFNNLTIFVSIFLLSLFILHDIKPTNIINFKNRYLEYININDKYFIDDDYVNLIDHLDKYQPECIQIFSYDAIIPYLLKKKFCTKYNFIYAISNERLQNNFIRELKDNKPEYIVYNKNFKFIRLIPVKKRFLKIYNYINHNYYIDSEIRDWVIFKKKI